MLVVSSGSAGSAFLNNHTVAGGAIMHSGVRLPETLRERHEGLATRPPARGGDWRSTVCRRRVPESRHSARRSVGHACSGSGARLDGARKGSAIRRRSTYCEHVDGEIRRIEDGLRAAGLFEAFNIWVTSDHGFSTHTGAVDVDAILKPFAGALPDGSPRIVANGGAIYVRERRRDRLGDRAALQQTPGVGAIFTRATRAGSSTAACRARCRSTPCTGITIDRHRSCFRRTGRMGERAWRARHGQAGGTAGHGSSSPWDVHNTLIAAGPDLKQGVTIDVPSANVDFAPTFLKLLGLAIPPRCRGGPRGSVRRGRRTRRPASVTTTSNGAYARGRICGDGHAVDRSLDGREYRYFDGTTVTRR